MGQRISGHCLGKRRNPPEWGRRSQRTPTRILNSVLAPRLPPRPAPTLGVPRPPEAPEVPEAPRDTPRPPKPPETPRGPHGLLQRRERCSRAAPKWSKSGIRAPCVAQAPCDAATLIPNKGRCGTGWAGGLEGIPLRGEDAESVGGASCVQRGGGGGWVVSGQGEGRPRQGEEPLPASRGSGLPPVAAPL